MAHTLYPTDNPLTNITIKMDGNKRKITIIERRRGGLLFGVQEWREDGCLIHTCECEEPETLSPYKRKYLENICEMHDTYQSDTEGDAWVNKFVLAGILHGSQKTRYNAKPYLGKLRHDYNYVQGKKCGIQREFYNTGALASRTEYNAHWAHLDAWVYRLDGSIFSKDVYENGTLCKKITYNNRQSIHRIIPYKNDMVNGEVLIYYDNGHLEERVQYVNNKMHGMRTKWYSNGYVKVKENYRNDKLNGQRITSDDNGQLIDCEYYIDNIRYPKNISRLQTMYRKNKLSFKLKMLAKNRKFVELWWSPDSKGGYYAKKSIERAVREM